MSVPIAKLHIFAENLIIYFPENAENLIILALIAENLTIYFPENAENLTILSILSKKAEVLTLSRPRRYFV
jgi:hypothetical protein